MVTRQDISFRLSCLFLLLALPLSATTYTVKAGGGGNYTTIQACATAMAAGDTCVVYAGTYAETPTLTAGTAGNIKTIAINPGDTVNVLGFVAASYTTITGAGGTFNITNPSSPTGGYCWKTPHGTTHATITQTVMSSCGNGAYMMGEQGDSTTGSSYITISNNTISYACDTAGALNACKVIEAEGDHWLIDGNTATHVADFLTLFANHSVIRNNNFNTLNTNELGSNSSNGHVDFVESEPSTSTEPVSAYNLIEGNSMTSLTLSTCPAPINTGCTYHSILTQGDACTGCTNMIERFNIYAPGGGTVYGKLDDLANYPYVKTYNETTAFSGVNNDDTDTFGSTSTNGGAKNSIWWYSGSYTLNPYGVVGSAGTGWSAGNNLAWCTGSCTFHASTYGSGAWTGDTGNIQSDPSFVDSASNNFNLNSGSPARSAGSYLTTTNGSGTSSTTLVVNDASWFFDGAGGIVNADTIKIAGNAPVLISSINYATNTITLASAQSWSTSTGVYLYAKSDGVVVLNNTNPDMGALQFGGALTGTKTNGRDYSTGRANGRTYSTTRLNGRTYP